MFSFQISCQIVAARSVLMLKNLQTCVSSLSFVFVFRVCGGLCECGGSGGAPGHHVSHFTTGDPSAFCFHAAGDSSVGVQLKPHTVLVPHNISVQFQVCVKTFGLWASRCRWVLYGCYLQSGRVLYAAKAAALICCVWLCSCWLLYCRSFLICYLEVKLFETENTIKK